MKFNTAFALFVTTMTSSASASASALASEELPPRPTRKTKTVKKDSSSSSSSSKPAITTDTECMPDGYSCGNIYCKVQVPPHECRGCVHCCNSYHLGDDGLGTYCGPDPSCWGKDTLCVPGVSCTKCCHSWSMYFTGPYCD